MKQLYIFFMILSFGHIGAQKSVMKTQKHIHYYQYQKVFKWEAYTEKGVVIFGVSKSKAEAEATIKDFTRRNWHTSARPHGHIIREDLAKTQDYFDTFSSYCPKGYRVLSTRDIAALRVFDLSDLITAATYLDQCSKMSYGRAMQYLSNLHNNFEPYRISTHMNNK